MLISLRPVGGNTTIVTDHQRDARPTVTFPAYAGTIFILLGDRSMAQRNFMTCLILSLICKQKDSYQSPVDD